MKKNKNDLFPGTLNLMILKTLDRAFCTDTGLPDGSSKSAVICYS